MFIGHFALGYAVKRRAPGLSLAALFGAAQLADLIWPVLVGLGVEQVRIDPGNTASTPLDFVSYPYSHSLAALILWGFLFGALCQRFVPGRRVLLLVAGLVVSHWFFDVLVHRPDVPLYPGGPKLGLGLWNLPNTEKAVEIGMYAIGVTLYARATRARDWIGEAAFWTLAVFLLAGFMAASAPPPSVTALWMTAIAGAAVILAWSWWADRHRQVVGTPE